MHLAIVTRSLAGTSPSEDAVKGLQDTWQIDLNDAHSTLPQNMLGRFRQTYACLEHLPERRVREGSSTACIAFSNNAV